MKDGQGGGCSPSGALDQYGSRDGNRSQGWAGTARAVVPQQNIHQENAQQQSRHRSLERMHQGQHLPTV